MIDRNSPVTEDELHAYVDGELAGGAPRRCRGMAGEPSRACRPRRRMARAGGRHPGALWRARRAGAAGALRPRQAHAQPALVARGRGSGGDRGIRRRRRRSAGWRTAPPRQVRPHSKPSPWRRSAPTGSISPRCATRSRSRAGEEHLLPWLSRRVGATLRAPELDAFSLKLLGGRLLPGLNGPAALVHVRRAHRRALHVLLLAREAGRARRCATPSPTRSPPCTGSRARSAMW